MRPSPFTYFILVINKMTQTLAIATHPPPHPKQVCWSQTLDVKIYLPMRQDPFTYAPKVHLPMHPRYIYLCTQGSFTYAKVRKINQVGHFIAGLLVSVTWRKDLFTSAPRSIYLCAQGTFTYAPKVHLPMHPSPFTYAKVRKINQVGHFIANQNPVCIKDLLCVFISLFLYW